MAIVSRTEKEKIMETTGIFGSKQLKRSIRIRQNSDSAGAESAAESAVKGLRMPFPEPVFQEP